MQCYVHKIEIKKFSGHPTNWKAFIESFDAAIYSNPYLSNIEKMNYLVNILVGEAETAVKGLTLGNQNYVIARDF